jgi:hypothetical protein
VLHQVSLGAVLISRSKNFCKLLEQVSQLLTLLSIESFTAPLVQFLDRVVNI